MFVSCGKFSVTVEGLHGHGFPIKSAKLSLIQSAVSIKYVFKMWGNKYKTMIAVFHNRNQMKAHLLMNSESQDTVFEDIGSQVSIYLFKGLSTTVKRVLLKADWKWSRTQILRAGQRSGFEMAGFLRRETNRITAIECVFICFSWPDSLTDLNCYSQVF